MLNYLRIFNFLWRVKRVEFTIAQIWKLHVKSQRLTKQSKYLRRAYLVSHSIRNEMQHFIANFYNYVMLEAVETAWTKFNDELLKAKDLA
jgi:gamma-tubulin complex component 3